MCTNEILSTLMLDAIRRGFTPVATRAEPTMAARDGSIIHAYGAHTRIADMKRAACHNIDAISPQGKLQVLLAVARIAGIDAIASHNGGCLVDVSGWNDAQMRDLLAVEQLAARM